MSHDLSFPGSAAIDTNFNPMAAPHRDDPFTFYRWSRQEQPVCFSPALGAWMVTRYHDILRILRNPALFSSKNALPDLFDNPPEIVRMLEAAGFERGGTTIVDADEPEHAPLRRMLNHAMSARRVRALAPAMLDRAGELIDGFADSGFAELVAEYADPYVQVIVSLLFGIPREDIDTVQSWTEDFMYVRNPLVEVEKKAAPARRLADYHAYVEDLIAERRACPTEDLLSDMIHGSEGFAPMSDRDVHSFFRGGRVAGYDTTRDLIASAILDLVRDRPRLRAVQEDPRLIPTAVEETLRRDAPHRGLRRITTEDVTVGGVDLPRGAPLLLLFGSANRDETVFADPDTFDPNRTNVRKHLGFGKGIHQCPGAQLARTEVRIALEVLTTRLPDLEPAPGYEPRYVPSYLFRGLESLDVVWH
jgi:cytochrome P450